MEVDEAEHVLLNSPEVTSYKANYFDDPGPVCDILSLTCPRRTSEPALHLVKLALPEARRRHHSGSFRSLKGRIRARPVTTLIFACKECWQSYRRWLDTNCFRSKSTLSVREELHGKVSLGPCDKAYLATGSEPTFVTRCSCTIMVLTLVRDYNGPYPCWMVGLCFNIKFCVSPTTNKKKHFLEGLNIHRAIPLEGNTNKELGRTD